MPKSYLRADAMRLVQPSPLEKEVVMGTLLGDGSMTLVSNGFYRLNQCHGTPQVDYLRYKVNCLPSLFMAEPVHFQDGSHDQWHCTSISHSWLNEMRGALYRDGKKYVRRRFLNLLTETSLLFWYLDDGSRMASSGDSIVFCTDSFSLGELRAIKQWFWQKFRVRGHLMEVHGGVEFKTSDKSYTRIRFRKDDSCVLFRAMKSSPLYGGLPASMRYKFPDVF